MNYSTRDFFKKVSKPVYDLLRAFILGSEREPFEMYCGRLHMTLALQCRRGEGTSHEKAPGAQLTRALSISSVGIARRCASCACT